MDEENKGLTIGQFFKIVFSRKWLALAIAAVITVAGTLALYLGFGKNYKYFEGGFSLTFQNNNSVYPDGTAFNVGDLISRQNLSEIRRLDSDFSNINIEQMANKGGISIYVTEDDSKSSALTEYTLKFDAEYFENEEQAQKFAEYVINTPIRYINSIATDETYNEKYSDTDFYEEKIEILKERADYTFEIASMIENSGSLFKKACKTLKLQLESFSKKIDKTIIEMRGELTDAGQPQKMIVHNVEEVKNLYKELIKTIENKLKVLQDEFDYLTGGGDKSVVSYGDAVSSRIAQLAREMAESNKLLETYKLYTGDRIELVEKPEYVDTINGLNDELENYIEDFSIVLEGYSLGNITIFKGEGNIPLLTSILISFAVGVVIAVITAFCVGLSAIKKAESDGQNNAGSGEPEDKTENKPSSVE